MMEADNREALRAKEMAEKQLVKKEFADAKMYALKARSLCPSLDGISQMLATLDVYMASQAKVNGEVDFYAVLGVNPLADDESVKKQYRKLALNLHPDKNKTVGAEGAFKFVSEAWSTLSNSSRRALYDQRRSMSFAESPRKNHSSSNWASTVNGSRKRPKSSDCNDCTKRSTFWTTCSSCKMQFEYLRIYVNRNLTCQNCWSTFIAIETGKSPTSISTPFVPSTTAQRNNHVLPENNCSTYYLANSFHYIDSEISAFPCGIVTENTPQMTVQWAPLHGSVANIHVSSVAAPPMVVGSSYERAKRASEIPRSSERNLNNGSSGVASYYPGCTTDQSAKKMKSELTASTNNMSSSKFEHSVRNDRNEGPKRNEKDAFPDKTHANSFDTSDHQPPFLFNFDARKLLIEKTKREISKKLEEMRSGASTKSKVRAESSGKEKYQTKIIYTDTIAANAMPGVRTSNSLNSPCPSFHNFDKDRSEVCFKPQQVWAIYDDDDGMPRLYAFVHKIISLNPFRIQLSYLNAKSNSEFASVDWIASGFNKTCGTFVIGRCEVMCTVNVFSHVVAVEWGIQGIVRILPKRGDIWALYKYWSPEWDDTTPTEIRHQYEIVEVLDNYTLELGVRVISLDKSAGFMSVYKRQHNAKRWVPRDEMFRFSHQVPSWLLRGDEADSLPNRCWDLDPAATPANVIEPER